MNCPKDGSELRRSVYQGVEVDSCEVCRGVWLDHDELDVVEDAHFSQDELKGMLTPLQRDSKVKCPKCQEGMFEFNYRFSDLVLEFCPHKHGWWFDGEEIRKVDEIMEQKTVDILDKRKAEQGWENKLRVLKSPTFVDDVILWINEKLG